MILDWSGLQKLLRTFRRLQLASIVYMISFPLAASVIRAITSPVFFSQSGQHYNIAQTNHTQLSLPAPFLSILLSRKFLLMTLASKTHRIIIILVRTVFQTL